MIALLSFTDYSKAVSAKFVVQAGRSFLESKFVKVRTTRDSRHMRMNETSQNFKLGINWIHFGFEFGVP